MADWLIDFRFVVANLDYGYIGRFLGSQVTIAVCAHFALKLWRIIP